MTQVKWTRKDRREQPENYGWRHIDIRLNKDGTFDILLDSLGVVGDLAGKAAKIEGFKAHAIPTLEQALEHGKMIDEWLEQQSDPRKRTTKAERADTHYAGLQSQAPAQEPPKAEVAPAPATTLVLEHDEPPPPPPEPVKPKYAPPPPSRKETTPAKPKPAGKINLGLFDE